MPVVQLPISKGLVTDSSEADWLDSLPVNMVAVPKSVLNAKGYMRSWPGLTFLRPSAGVARGAVFNVVDEEVYRITGTKLINSAGTELADVGGFGLAQMPFSSNSQAIVSDGNLYFWRDNTLTQLQNWAENERGASMPATSFTLGTVIDAVRNRGRYAWIIENSGRFGVTDLQNEQRPDYIAPFYSAEAEPDQNIAIDAWKGYVVIFGRFTVEYFGLTGSAESIYSPAQSLTVRAGIVGRGCKCQYLDSFAIIGGPQFEPPSVFLINQGSYQEIANRRIQKILRNYTLQEIETLAYIEPVKFDNHEFLVIHLPDDVLIFDYNASQAAGGSQWTVLKTDIAGDLPYRGVFHINDGSEWTVGDKRESVISTLSFSDARHLGAEVEYQLDTPMIQARNRRLYDLEIDNIPGRTNENHQLAYSITFDGITYGQEHWIHLDEPRDYRQRVLARRLGYSKNNIGFRLRWITDSPSSISDFRIRVE